MQLHDELVPLEVTVNRADIVRYAGASTDFNEIHFSDRHARAIGLPGVVAHGMWTMGCALSLVTREVGDPSSIVDYTVRFTRPVVVPDTDDGVTVTFSGTVSAEDDETFTISISASADEHSVFGAARARVKKPHNEETP